MAPGFCHGIEPEVRDAVPFSESGSIEMDLVKLGFNVKNRGKIEIQKYAHFPNSKAPRRANHRSRRERYRGDSMEEVSCK